MKNCTRQVVLDYVNIDHLFNNTHIVFKKTNSVAPPQIQKLLLGFFQKMENKMSAYCVSAVDLLRSNMLYANAKRDDCRADSKCSRWCSSICERVAVDIFNKTLPEPDLSTNTALSQN